MSKANPFLMALMPLSQITSWYLMTRPKDSATSTSDKASLYSPIWRLAVFYAGWAIVNRINGNKKELGHVSMGIMALTTYFDMPKAVTASAAALVVANFLVPVKTIFVDWDIATLARKMNKTTMWAYVFRGYFVSSISLWSIVLYKIVKMEE